MKRLITLTFSLILSGFSYSELIERDLYVAGDA